MRTARCDQDPDGEPRAGCLKAQLLASGRHLLAVSGPDPPVHILLRCRRHIHHPAGAAGANYGSLLHGHIYRWNKSGDTHRWIRNDKDN